MDVANTKPQSFTSAVSEGGAKGGLDWAGLRHRLENSQTGLRRKIDPSLEDKRQILRARARSMATRGTTEAAPADLALEIVEFVLGAEHYGIELQHIREIHPLSEFTPLPCTPAFVLGLVNVRGQIISIINIKKLFDLSEQGLTDLNKVIIVHNKNKNMELGILADAIVGVRSLALGELQTMLPLPGSTSICGGLTANLNSLAHDQRGFSRTTSYSGTPCVDAGAGQTNYTLIFTQQPSSVPQNAAMDPAPTVSLKENGLAFTASSATIPLSLTTGTGTPSGNSTTTSAGVATYSALEIDTAGTGDILTASLTLNSATSTSISVASNSFEVAQSMGGFTITGLPANATAGTSQTITVTALDGNGNTFAGYFGTVHFTSSDTGATLPADYTFTVSDNGVHTFTSGVVLNAAGSQTVTGTDTVESSGTGSDSTIIAASSASAVSVVSGSAQSAGIATAFANPLTAKVTDAFGNPVAGVTVTFTAPSSGASATFSTAAVSASDGTTSVTATANGIADATAYTVTATISGGTTSANFSLTNTKASTSVAVTPGSTSVTYGQSVTLSAAVTPNNVNGSVPSGSVTFYDGSTALTPDSTLASASASYTVDVPAVGSHTYGAQYQGDGNFSSSAQASASSAVVVNKASSSLTPAATSQTLTYNAGGTISITVAGQFSGTGIALPTGNISYTIGTGSAQTATISGGVATVTVPDSQAVGSYTITVNYAGDGNYNAATPASISLEIDKATATATLGSLSATYDGNPHAASATTNPASLDVTFTYDGSSTAPTAAGSYAVVGTINDANYSGTATGTLVIDKATATVTLGSLSATYDGNPHAATATTTPASLTVNFTYDGSSTAPTAAGSYTVVGTINDPTTPARPREHWLSQKLRQPQRSVV
jgi:chemotaxis signal transduction protein